MLSYRLESPYTKLFVWLGPAVFEPFFHYIRDPTEAHVFPRDAAAVPLPAGAGAPG